MKKARSLKLRSYSSKGNRKNSAKSGHHKKRVMVFGTFDRLHPGHEFFLREAGKLGSLTIVIARWQNVLKIKGRSPVESEYRRIKAIKKLFPRFRAIPGSSKDFLKPVRSIRPDLIILGYDQKLPPGLNLSDLKCKVRRTRAFKPHLYKSSFKPET